LLEPVARKAGTAGSEGARRNLLLRRTTQAAHSRRLRHLDDLTEKITAFEKRYNHPARPFDWRFDRTDLNQLMQRIEA
jgi:hypothetical protein